MVITGKASATAITNATAGSVVTVVPSGTATYTVNAASGVTIPVADTFTGSEVWLSARMFW